VRAVALVDSLDHVCCRYRLRAFAPHLAAAGHRLDLHTWPRGLARLRPPAADVIIVQRRLPPAWERARLRAAARHLVFDFDDAVFLRDSYHSNGPHSARRRRRFVALVRASDAVVAGNDWLAARAADAGGRNVRVIPTCVDVSAYQSRAFAAEGQAASFALRSGANKCATGLTLVWVGSASTLQGLVRARPLLEQLGRSIAGLRLRVVCDAPLHLDYLPVEHVPWTAAGEAGAIAGADVGISILPEDDWSRGKCGLKVLQYLAAGLPVVGNPVGVTAEQIRGAGFLATTTDEWVAAIQRLRDPALRQSLGAAGRATVQARYDVCAGAAAWRRLLDEFAARVREAG